MNRNILKTIGIIITALAGLAFIISLLYICLDCNVSMAGVGIFGITACFLPAILAIESV
jgi:hypothetical protein